MLASHPWGYLHIREMVGVTHLWTTRWHYSPVDPEVYCISGISVGSTWSRVTVTFLSSLSWLILVVECHGIAVLALRCSI